MKKICIGYVLLTIGLYELATAKNNTKSELNFVELVNQIYHRSNEVLHHENLQETLWRYYQQPLVLNEVDHTTLTSLYILTPKQVDNFFLHIQHHGPLISIYELQAIPSFDLATIQLLLPFIKVEEVGSYYSQRPLANRMTGKNNSWVTRYDRILEQKRGYKKKSNLQSKSKKQPISYLGSPDKIVTKFHIWNPNDFSIGFAGKKNAGENFIWDASTKRFGFNTWALHYCLYNKQRLKILVIGNYQVGYGQGLIHHAGFALNKTTDAIRVIRTNNTGLKPQKSIGQAKTLQGVATTFHWPLFEVTTYYSNQYFDGKIEQNQDDSHYTTNVIFANDYKTTTNLNKKGKVHEHALGNIIVYNNEHKAIQIGFSTLLNYYSVPIYPKSTKLNQYIFHGKNNYNIGFFYRYLWKNILFFGETGICKSKGKGTLLGFLSSLSKKIDVTTLWHHYDKNFHNPYGNAFGYGSNNNESGIYIGFRFQPMRRITIHSYYDYTWFPWPKKNIDSSSNAYDGRVIITYQLAPSLLLGGQFREKSSAKNKPRAKKKSKKKIEHTSRPIAYQKNYTTSLYINYKLASILHCKTQVKWTHYIFQHIKEWGYALVQDCAYNRKKGNIGIRIAFFNTDSWHSRLYFYQKYSLGPPPFYQYKGMHCFIYLVHKIMQNWKMTFKIGRIYYLEKNPLATTSNVPERIDSRHKTAMMLQLSYRF